MSYALELSAVALDRLRDMPVWLQEETLDELDQLAAGAPTLKRRAADELVVHDFTRVEGGNKHYVFITLNPEEATRVLGVADIGYVVRAVP